MATTTIYLSSTYEDLRWLSQRSVDVGEAERHYIQRSVARREQEVREQRAREEQELLQAKRLAEEASKREEAERARAAAAEEASKAAEEARQAQQARAETAERARRRQRYFSVVLTILFVGGWITVWLWQKGYSVEHAGLKIQSFFISLHIEPEMRSVPTGTFRRGDIHGLGDESEQPVHEVSIKAFAMGRFEVTFEEYDRFAIDTNRPLPSDQKWGRGRRPVINVSWHDAKDYAEWLSRQTGKRYRLPSESEWEYAARGDEKEHIWPGTSNEKQLKNYAVYAANSGNRTAPVGQDRGRQPNALGLYDLSGNILEWVEDCVHRNYHGAPTDGTAWLEAGGGECVGHVLRGGSWGSDPAGLRASFRFWLRAVNQYNGVGFRLAQDIP